MPTERRARSLERELRRVISCALACLLASCVWKEPTARRAASDLGAPAPRTHVVLVTLDGARAEEIFGGADAELADQHGLKAHERPGARALAPELRALVEHGAATLGVPGEGASLRASGPDFISLPGYAELLTGRGPSSCKDNDCAWVSEPTLVDALASRYGCDPRNAAAVTSWPDIGRVVARNARCSSISSGRSGGVNLSSFHATPELRAAHSAAKKLDPWPGLGDFRRDAATGTLLSELLRGTSARLVVAEH